MRYVIIIIILFVYIFTGISSAHAFWMWTPKTMKFINPKYAVKDTPEEQYKWAMSFFEKGEYVRAGDEFVRLVENYKNSKLAPEAQYYAGLSYQKAGKYYPAFQNYQKVIKNYPFSTRIEEIIKAEYEIGMIFYSMHEGKLMGKEIILEIEKAIEIFQAIIENMPYSSIADQAQYMIGLSFKKTEQYTDAVNAFQKLIQEYPTSPLVDKGRYELAQCMYLASRQAAYDQETTDAALEEFKKYSEEAKDAVLRAEAKDTLHRLREKKAKDVYDTAIFYEKQKKWPAARMYYSQVTSEYQDTSYAELAKKRLESVETNIK